MVRNPMQARAGGRARFSVSAPVTAITAGRAQRDAWAHASRIVNREADHSFDYSA